VRHRDKAGKARRHKALTRNTRKAASHNQLARSKGTTVARLASERDKLQQQQTAMAEILGVISNSPTDLAPVFDAILSNATRLCDGNLAALWRYDGQFLIGAAQYNASPEFVDKYMGMKLELGRSGPARLAALERRTVHVADITAEPGFSPKILQFERARTVLAVPLLRKTELVGVIAIWRREVRPFDEQQVALVQTFAAQAATAIENTRLLNELRQRTDDLSESLKQQTATSEVLKVISSSRGELEPVFEALLTNAARICEARFAILYLRDGDTFRAVAATRDAPPAYVEARKRDPQLRPPPDSPLGRVAATKQLVHIEDLATVRSYVERHPFVVAAVELGGFRSTLAVPLLKNDQLVGSINIFRQEVRPFSTRQIELVENFAAQAVIAIENTRLLNELRESLQQQTATADVLKVISSSPGQLEPVFRAMLENAVRICGAKFGMLYLSEGEGFRTVATHDVPRAFAEKRAREPFFIAPAGSPMGRVKRTRQVAHIADITTVPDYVEDRALRDLAELGGARTVAAAPMLKDDKLIGAIVIYRQESQLFTDKQIELVQNFAAQAVIAIENTRLLNELRESLQQQTATADVLKVISSSPGTLDPVFSTMLAKATELCEASYGTLWLQEGDGYRTAAIYGDLPPVWIEQWRSGVLYRPRRDVPLARAAEERQPIQIADMRADPSYLHGDPLPVSGVEIAGIRTLLVVPMFRESEFVGAIAIYRKEVLPFTGKQIELIKNFAAQAVIAIENTRLLNELRESLQQQTATADVLKVISRSTFDLGTVLQTLVESAARLCGADKTNITRQKDGVFFRAEAYGFSPEFRAYVRNIPIQPDRGSAFGRALLERRAVHIPDVKADPEYTLVEGQKLGGYRTVLAVPMLREGVVIGVLSLTRSEVRPFYEKQIQLATTFADQAAIAIENVRLFENVEARTRELAKSLEDLRATQDRLVQTQKLASLGQLTAGIAHEIKNPLNFVNNFSGLSAELIDELQDTLKGISLNDKTRVEINELTHILRGNLDKVVQHGKRADAIVKNMLLHSREGSGEHRVVDINALVEESLNLAYHGARAEKQGFNITLQRSFDPEAGQADVFPQDITRVLLNLISNGFYAATKRKAESGIDGYEPTLVASTRSLGDSVEIRVRDNGTGIPPDVKDKIFNPFFTTKPAGEGTGLGLSISHDVIVKQHAGSIEVDTQPGEFTEFRIILPRAALAITKLGDHP
jgi:two-component system, NtrC family, sensor kinase